MVNLIIIFLLLCTNVYAAQFGDVTIMGILVPQINATPTTDTTAETSFDSNAWASGRGALQLFDGTASTYILGALASDLPSNGEVPKWNTGGTITWEADNNTAGITAGDTQVIFSDGANNPVGDAGMTYNKTTNILSADGFTTNSSAAAGYLQLFEPSGAGTNFIKIQTPATLAGDITWTLPSADTAGFFASNGSGTVALTAPSSTLSTTLTNETGTGVAVFDTSPTLTTPVVSGTPAGAAAIGYDTTQKMVTTYGGATAIAGSVSRVIAAGVGTQTLTNSTASDQDFTSMYTFPASSIYTNKVYRVTITTEVISGTSAVTLIKYLKLGSTKVFTSLAADNVTDGRTQSVTWIFYIFGRAAAGAAAATTTSASSNLADNGSNNNGVNQPVNLATNGTLTINFGVTYSGTGSTESVEQQGWIIEELN